MLKSPFAFVFELVLVLVDVDDDVKVEAPVLFPRGLPSLRVLADAEAVDAEERLPL